MFKSLVLTPLTAFLTVIGFLSLLIVVAAVCYVLCWPSMGFEGWDRRRERFEKAAVNSVPLIEAINRNWAYVYVSD